MTEQSTNDDPETPGEHSLIERIETSTPDEFLNALRKVVSQEVVGPFPGVLQHSGVLFISVIVITIT
jgi:uncharacterized membrane protein